MRKDIKAVLVFLAIVIAVGLLASYASVIASAATIAIVAATKFVAIVGTFASIAKLAPVVAAVGL